MKKNKRFWEMDALRGTAIIMMLLSNLMTDLNYFNIINSSVKDFWWWFARITASIFLFIVGISLTLSYSKKKEFTKFFKRGIKIFFYGLIITIVTYLFIPKDYVIFGILHLIGASSIITYPLINKPFISLVLGIIILLTGLFTENLTINSIKLLWLGITPQYYSTVDYFPIIPWLGIILIGIYIGNKLYKDYERSFKIPRNNNILIKIMTFIGRNSLIIYLIHQPIILTILYLLGFTTI